MLSLAALAAFVSAFLLVSNARAFCRTLTEVPPVGFDPRLNGCFTGSPTAKALWWKSSCVGYSIQRAASRQVTLDQAEKVVADAFAAWSNAPCEQGGNPSVNAVEERPVDCDLVEYNRVGPNQHVIVFRDDVWPHHDASNTLGLTTITFDTRTGEIYDADMELNSQDAKLAVSDPIPSGSFDLRGIITHEAGHFLGLSHATDNAAVMFASYHLGMDMLTADDISGICSIYDPGGTRETIFDPVPPPEVPRSAPVPNGGCMPESRHHFSEQCGSTNPNPFDIDELEASGGCSMVRARPGFGSAAWCVAALALVVRRRRLAMLAAAVLALGLGVAEASVSFAIAFDDLVRSASAVSVVTPIEQYAAWENGRIYTFTRVRSDSAIAGPSTDGVWVKTMGGAVGDIGQQVEGEAALALGLPMLLFLEPDVDAQRKAPTGLWRVAGRAQGQFLVTTDTTTSLRRLVPRRSGSLVLRPGARRNEVRFAYDVMADRVLDDAVRDIRAAWQELHRP